MLGGGMTPEWIGVLLTALGLLGTGCAKLWRDLRESRKAELLAAEERAYQRARNEALAREATAAVVQKTKEIDALQALNVRQSERIDQLVSALRHRSEGRSA